MGRPKKGEGERVVTVSLTLARVQVEWLKEKYGSAGNGLRKLVVAGMEGKAVLVQEIVLPRAGIYPIPVGTFAGKEPAKRSEKQEAVVEFFAGRGG